MPSLTEPPYLRIAAEIRARILTGELAAGDRVPSVRQIARRWGVALATANRALATLRENGLVEAKVGSGTVVSASAGRKQPEPVPGLNRRHILRTAVEIADVEGLDAVSMRRVAAELGAGPMALYRHVASKDELVRQMADEVFAELELPNPGPDGWRAKLELVARGQWALCHRHLWLPRAVSFTRPLLAPNMMAQTEWTLRALDGLGLPMAARLREALTLHSLVVTTARSLAEESETELETGVDFGGWWLAQRKRTDELLDSGQFPLLKSIPEETVADLDGLFEYGLARHLDGFAVLLR
ncbi:TetR/AcrR family transcriptional regulator C-terminal domain-containing protein [Amycolatopsis sp. YIM 10]|uniref:TetR/AcrR family transcriptional regulator C-terminal domain-containing protein n=1 Tax=Amycolatopsis sp. YIM 10 TaxID=2653857 RepID=UPI00128FF751|nr:TetR/AcrR family transcriptional regulator C-terminal domain-containing protein [Amycolatopsis sp. YIM 10]QFU91243.1 DNA-binding transcriptional repressor MngR [Amycolatopsis sp. YIM 10]